MYRSRRIILISHCILNANSKIRGGALYGDFFMPVIEYLMKQNSGIFQLPCPEQSFLGEARWGQSRNQYNTPFYRKHCQSTLEPIISQLADYQKNGYKLLGVLGISGSPSCGVTYTFQADWGGEVDTYFTNPSMPSGELVNGAGVFMEIFRELSDRQGLDLYFEEVKENDLNTTMEVLQNIFIS